MSEVECQAGLSCQIQGAAVDSSNRPLSSCTAENPSRPAGAPCDTNADCRNGTCALGHCVDLCQTTRDCGSVTSCVKIPFANNAAYLGCLPLHGTVTWSLPVDTPSYEVLLPVPEGARSAELVMTVDDASQEVGATRVLSPAGTRIYTLPCSPLGPSEPPCDQVRTLDEYFGNEIRHLPAFGQSVLAIPTGATSTISTGIYQVELSSLRSNGTPGSAIPRVSAVVQLGRGVTLDLHFFFLNLDDHPCAAMTDHATLDASAAQTAEFFQTDYLDELRTVFGGAGLVLSTPTYNDIKDHPELDGLDVAGAGALLSLGTFATGINVFFVRSLSPIGLQAFGPNPGPAGIAGSPQSGIVIALDTLCYRNWTSVARLTAHEIARYMGLYHNVELETAQHPTWRDQLLDSDASTNNLMYFSERFDPSTATVLPAGFELSPGQRQILTNSAVLR
jgi:hypothetical protein